MAEWQVELSWTCAGCKSKVLGRHTTCTTCGKPKENEEYEMPADVAEAAPVTDPALLALARAGENWRCAYCASDRRAGDGSCARCGAGRQSAPAPVAAAAAPRPRSRAGVVVAVAVAAALGVVGVGVALAAAQGGARREIVVRHGDETRRTVKVAKVTWEYVVAVDAWQLQPREGFSDTVPAGAVEVRSLGEREHHQEEVPDGFRTESYTVEVPDGFRSESYTVEVPDGFRSESYTERVACGQDCTTRPQTCRRECTNGKNGFANCRDVCTGGGQSCTPRYCNESRTRQIPKTRTETRTRQIPKTRTETRTREVPKTKRVPRFAPFASWKEWGWSEVRTLREAGEGGVTRWPDASLAPDDGGPARERARKSQVYRVTFEDGRGARYDYSPASEAELAALANRTDELRIRIAPTVSPLP
ncbi:MAG: hypothetical protein JNL38_28925 [Myxococcales bacterium]|nr:hypothetical protein [Myxococcales bacterium]